MKTTSRAPHPAKFTDALLPHLDLLLREGGCVPPARVLDPMAGVGKGVEHLRSRGYEAEGIELEPDWAEQSPHVRVGNVLHLPYPDGHFDGVFTSPTYGNRMADVDLRESAAGSYAKALGRRASEGSSCHLQWGDVYQGFHVRAWAECVRVLRPGGAFVLNCKDHVRNRERQHVTRWHVETLESLGLVYVTTDEVPVPSLRWGANSEARLPTEYVVLLTKEAT